jgi:hypothetical protein
VNSPDPAEAELPEPPAVDPPVDDPLITVRPAEAARALKAPWVDDVEDELEEDPARSRSGPNSRLALAAVVSVGAALAAGLLKLPPPKRPVPDTAPSNR